MLWTIAKFIRPNSHCYFEDNDICETFSQICGVLFSKNKKDTITLTFWPQQSMPFWGQCHTYNKSTYRFCHSDWVLSKSELNESITNSV